MSEAKQKKVTMKETFKEQVIYIGPDIPSAKQYTVFNNGLPEALKEKMIEKPFFSSLIVPVTKLAEAIKELEREGSALSILYKKASEK